MEYKAYILHEDINWNQAITDSVYSLFNVELMCWDSFSQFNTLLWRAEQNSKMKIKQTNKQTNERTENESERWWERLSLQKRREQLSCYEFPKQTRSANELLRVLFFIS